MDERPQPDISPQPENLISSPAHRDQVEAPEKPKKLPWQERLLPLMGSMLVALTAFFFLVTFLQMSYLHWSIFQSPPIQMETASSDAIFVSTNRFEDLFEARQFEVRAAMERYIIEKRYHQISVLLMSGLWLRYLGFITGMILALVGASFILGKLREPEQSLEGKFSEVASLSLRTTSPGIILAVLGVVLMFATLMDKDLYNVKDANVYLSVIPALSTPVSGSGEKLPELPEFLDNESSTTTNQPLSTPGSPSIDGENPILNLPRGSDNEP